MSTLEDLDDMEQDKKEQGSGDGDKDPNKKPDGGDQEMKDADSEKKEEKDEDIIDLEILHSSTRDIINRRRLLENDMKVMRSEFQRLTHEQNTMKEKIKDNLDKIENNRFANPDPGSDSGGADKMKTITLFSRECHRIIRP